LDPQGHQQSGRIIINSGGTLAKVAAIGDTPPEGTPFNGPFTAEFNGEPFGPAINNQGDIASPRPP